MITVRWPTEPLTAKHQERNPVWISQAKLDFFQKRFNFQTANTKTESQSETDT